jgi:anaerobic selenocysteine-containing dehydrogenase
MAATTHKTYCRFCHNYCAFEVDVEDGRAVAVRGDAGDPIYGGYSCIKGRQLPEAHAHPERVTRPLKRMPDGTHEEIPLRQALDEIADRVAQIRDRHGPRAIASYCGTYAFQNSAALAVSKAWHKGIGSPSYYTSVTIDQPSKAVAVSRAGVWLGGTHGFHESDVVMHIGNNPIVSQFAPFGGTPPWNPVKELRDAKARGMKLIVVDPRRTDMARRADLYLQIRPGEDPTFLAGMLRIILDEQLHDQAFCAQWMNGLAELHRAVSEFDLDYVAQRTRLPKSQIEAAARTFARAKRGIAVTGTGPDMSPHPTLTEHLVICLNLICGRVNREGEKVPNPGVLSPATPKKAQPSGPFPLFGHGPRSRVRGLGEIIGEMPSAALSDEILLEGEGQVRALFVIGGNPLVAWPDQRKAMRAIDALDLLVCVDVRRAATAKHADYVLPGKLCLERADVPILCDTWYELPYTHYTPAIVEPPEGSDTLEEWELYWELSARLGTPIRLAGGELPLDRKPSKDDVLACMLKGGRVPFDEVRKHRGGTVYADVEERVAPADPGCDKRFALAPDGIAEELAQVRRESLVEPFSHRLISRRLRQVYNSSGRDLSESRKKGGTTNPAFMNPADLEEIGVRDGDVLEIASAHATIYGVAEAADDVMPGVVSMAHAWGDPAANPKEVREIGASTNALISNEVDFDPITGMARQSAIPVNVRRAPVSI